MGLLFHIMAVGSWDLALQDQRSLDNQLSPIFKGILDVRAALGEKFTSADIVAGTVDPTRSFNPGSMEDAYADERHGGGNIGGGAPDMVIVTVGMGLKKLMPSASTGGKFRAERIMSPKVILDSGLKAAMEPPPPRPSRPTKKPRRQDGGEPRGGESRKGESQKGESQKGEPQKGETQKGETQKGETQKEETPKGETQKGEPQEGEPQEGETQRETQMGETQEGETHAGETQGAKERGLFKKILKG